MFSNHSAIQYESPKEGHLHVCFLFRQKYFFKKDLCIIHNFMNKILCEDFGNFKIASVSLIDNSSSI